MVAPTKSRKHKNSVMRGLMSSVDRVSEVSGLYSGWGRPRETSQTPGTKLEVIDSEGRVQGFDVREARKMNGNTTGTPSHRVKAFFSGCLRERGEKRRRNRRHGRRMKSRIKQCPSNKKEYELKNTGAQIQWVNTHLFPKKHEREVRMGV